MLKNIQQDVEIRMNKSLDTLRHDLSKLRTGRAHPSLLESISVLYYGSPTPLNQLASIGVEDARTLSVNVFDKSAIKDVEKAIRTCELGLNPATSGALIRVPLPPLTEERRRDLIKVVRGLGEEARVSVRNIRRDLNAMIKEWHKSKEISEDEERKGEETIQKITDRFIAEIDKLLSAKELELSHV